MAQTMIHTTLPMKILDTLLVVSAFALNTMLIAADWQGFAVAAGGSFAGSITLVYYRREASRFEIFLKLIVSTMGGFILGTVFQEYFPVQSIGKQLGLFFFFGMGSVAICRAILSTTERNAGEVCKAALQRIFNLRLAHESPRTKSKGKRKVKYVGDGKFITLPEAPGDNNKTEDL